MRTNRGCYRVASNPLYWLFCVAILNRVVNAVNFTECLEEVNSQMWGQTGGRDNHGNPVNVTIATAVSYDLCILACGSGDEAFNWGVFSQQFSAWLLPWLALVSQLPFGGSHDNFDNFSSIFLAVGSPTLAAYSLALTVLNGHWVVRRFGRARFPNDTDAIRILNSLQQTPLKITTKYLASLVVLPENDNWWKKLEANLDYTETWSFSVAASILWVVIAFVLTVTNSFTADVANNVIAEGQAVGSAWMWLLPIVIGWRQISPKCDRERLRKAIHGANEIGYIVGEDGNPRLYRSYAEHAISLEEPSFERSDKQRTPPIFYYARFLYWLESVETLAFAFDCASDNARNMKSVSGSEWVGSHQHYPAKCDRRGTTRDVEKYCGSEALGVNHQPKNTGRRPNLCNPEILFTFFVASLFALILQWSTTGAAVMVFWLTPTKGLGCRSGAHFIYGGVSTFIWLVLVVSSTLAYYSSGKPEKSTARHTAHLFSVTLRRMGKILAFLNAIWIVVICLFQFTSAFKNCWCNGCVLGLGVAASYNVMALSPEDVIGLKAAWAGGVGLAAGCVVICVWFIGLAVSPRSPHESYSSDE